jgi:pyrimidine operon attenuation protein/uracil phosphoribosyltransferase
MFGKTLMTDENIRRSLSRIAHEIFERNGTGNNLSLVGIQTHGVPIAKRLSTTINEFAGLATEVIALDITRYRDDIPSYRRPGSYLHNPIIDINGKTVVLVDDVLYTGRTVRAAMDALVDLGRPREVQLAVLIDRGHREMPIRADYIGKNIPSCRTEIIKVRIAEIDGIDEVLTIGSTKTEIDAALQKEST